MRTTNLFLLTATVAALSSCAKKHLTTGPINLPGNAIAYVAGQVGDTAVYFVNGQEYTLTSGMTPASAKSIALSGLNIYVAGYESNGAHTVAKYWKNGVATILSDTSLNAVATAIAVTGSDVYVTGWVSVGSMPAAVLWKNGKLTALNATGHYGAANALCVSGTDVYVGGYDSAANTVTPCYWKNGALNPLPDSLSYAVATGIAVSASDVYVVGWDRNANGWYTYPQCWKNGGVQPLTNTGNYNAIATSVLATGSTTYITGEDNYRAVYWQNGTENLVVDGYQCNAAAINNGDLYFAGATANGGAYGYGPGFWRDGISLPLSRSHGSANSIVVTN